MRPPDPGVPGKIKISGSTRRMALNDTTYTQIFHREALNQLMTISNTFEIGTQKALNAIFKASRGGSLKQGALIRTYSLSKKSIPGQLGYGRYYSNYGMETLLREVRGTLCKDLYSDIDIVNCHCVLAEQYGQRKYNMAMTAFHTYNQNRDALFGALMKEGKSRDECKEELLKIMYDGTITKDTPDCFKDIATEMNQLYEHIKTSGEHQKLLDYIIRQKGKDLPGKRKNVRGSFLAFIFQTEERKCLDALVGGLRDVGLQVDVLAYDGCMVRTPEVSDECLRSAESYIKAQTGYDIELKVKPLETYTDLEAIAKAQSLKWDQMYETMRQRWEENHFYFMPTDTWAYKDEMNVIHHFSMIHAKNAYNTPEWILPPKKDGGEPIVFFNEWCKSPTRRIVRRVVAKMPCDCNEDEISLFNGWHFSELEPCESQEAITAFCDLVRCIAGDQEDTYQYLLKSFARMIQTPLKKSNVCVIISSKTHGSGKDTLMHWMSKIMGNHIAKYSSDDDFWNKYDVKREGAVMCYLEEAGVGKNKENSDSLKARITEDLSFINPKGLKGYNVPNIASYFMTTNNACPVKLEAEDRRFCILNPSDRFWKRGKEDATFWTTFYNNLESDEWISTIGNYLMQVDLTGFNTTLFPSTMSREIMIDTLREPSPEEMFLTDTQFEDVTSTALYNLYMDYCRSHDLKMKPSCVSFSIALTRFSEFFTKRTLGGRALYSKV